jgi:hypothetical protein
MILRLASSTPRENGTEEFRVVVDFDPEESRRIMRTKDLFEQTGIPLEPSVRLSGVQVRIDTPLQIAGLMIADEDTSARFTCSEDQYSSVVRELDRWLRVQLVDIALR